MEKLDFLRKQHDRLPALGSVSWRESRRMKIGGSEMAAALGKSPYQHQAQLVERKVTRSKANRSAACTFGRVFEDVAKHYIEMSQGVTVHRLGAIPSTMYPVCYAPDGIIVEGDELVLVEIKCPFRRSRIHEVPPHYACQVQTGMAVIPSKRAYFYQFRFRACTLGQMGNGPCYNRWLHFESMKRCPACPPLAWGYLHWEADVALVDLGALTGDDSDQLCFVDGKDYTIHHQDDEMPTRGYVLPWKLFDRSAIEITKDPTFMEDNSKALWDTYKRLKSA